ncbi:MAG: protein LphB [Legionella longbeachae]|nr:protein LphB [Legionella longbeachae]
MKFGLRWYDSILILLFIYLFVLQILTIWPFTIDDMYISLRYAKHWAEGNGLLWNLHSSPVEGYSNFIFVVLGAFTLLIKGNPVFVLKITGLLGIFFTCCFIYLISRFWFPRRESVLPSLGLLLYKGQIIWATSGLETAFYEALISGSVYFCLRAIGYQSFPGARKKSQNGYFIFAGVFLSLAGLTRPEAPVLMILFFLLICWDRPKEDLKKYWQGVFFFCLTLVIFYAPYFLWRILYYGFLFPNSVYCKGFSSKVTLFLDIQYIKLIWPFAVLAVPACIKAQDRRHYFLWLPSLVYLLILADADPIVAFDNRLFLPVFALLLPLALQGISTIVHDFWQKEDYVFGLLFYLGCIGVAFFFIPAMSLADYHYFCQNPLRGEELRGKVINWLNRNTHAGESVVLSDSGMIPYVSDLNFIDSYCLNNLSMAHYSAEQRYEQFCKEILLEKPEIIILTSLIEQGQIIYTPSDRCLRKLLLKQNEYKISNTFVTNSSKSIYRYELFKHVSD